MLDSRQTEKSSNGSWSTPREPAWYPLQTRYQCEKKVDLALQNEGFDSFAPVRLEKRRWSDRTKMTESPLFPGYTFVRMRPEPELFLKIMRLPGLVRFVTNGREFVPVPDEEMETVRILVRNDCHYEPGPFPALGEKVRIRGGCLEGVAGVLIGYRGRKELVISVGAIQRSLKIPLGAYDVERIA